MIEHLKHVDEFFTINKSEFYEYEARLVFEELIYSADGVEDTPHVLNVEVSMGDRWQDHVTFPFYELQEPEEFSKFADFVARLVAFKEQVERVRDNA